MVSLALIGVLACGRSDLTAGPTSENAKPPEMPPAPPAGGGGSSSDGGGGGAGGFGGSSDGGRGGIGGADEGGGGSTPVVAYANSYESLHAVGADGTSTPVGPLRGCDAAITDIALTSEMALFVTTNDALYVTDVASLGCELLAEQPQTYPNSLAVLPPGVLTGGETVVGYRDRTYLRINQDTGAVDVQGELSDNGFVSSGDLVWFDGRLLLSVTGPGCSDCIVQVDPLTGVDLAVLVALDTPSVFGLATWDDALYAFTGSGEIRRIDGADGTTTLLTAQSHPWLGATSTP